MAFILSTTSTFSLDLPEHCKDLQLVRNPTGRVLTKEELAKLVREIKPVALLAGTEPIGEDILREAGSFLKVISRVGVGWDNVDRQTAAQLGILVYRTEGVLTQAVAELTIGLILDALRLISKHDRSLRGGVWKKYMGGLFLGKTLGIIGFGAIGQRVGELSRAFGADVIYHDLQPVPLSWANFADMKELLNRSDIISLHASGKDRLLGEEAFRSLGKEGVVIVNTSRGSLIDEEALLAALTSGKIAAAALDVYDREPYEGPLTGLENVILTPHVGSYAKEARLSMEQAAIENLIRGLKEQEAL